jgi:creatinine amidohydrolase
MEQHGPHLPVSTDVLIAEHVAKRVAPLVGATVMPAIAYGVSFEHRPLFNASVRRSTLAATVGDVCASLAGQGFAQTIVLNGHHGNISALKNIKGRSVRVLHYWRYMKQELGHAGEAETSLMLAIAPELVDMKKAVAGARKPVRSAASTSRPGSFIRVTGNGVWGDPRTATAEKGNRLLVEITKNLANAIGLQA